MLKPGVVIKLVPNPSNQTNKESLIEKTQEDLLMKDPCQHLTYELTGTSGAVDFYVKHTNEGAESERASLLVAQLQYKAVTGEMSFTTSKRAESRLMVVKPLQIASKCASDLLKPLLATPRLDQFILSLIKVEIGFKLKTKELNKITRSSRQLQSQFQSTKWSMSRTNF